MQWKLWEELEGSGGNDYRLMDGQARKPDERVEGEKGTRTGSLRGICCMAGAIYRPNAIPTQSHCYVPNSMKSKRHAAS